jgi:hypothetical protein
MLSGRRTLLSKLSFLRVSPLPLYLWKPCPARVSKNRCLKILSPKALDIKIQRTKDLMASRCYLIVLLRFDHDGLILSGWQGQMSQWGCGFLEVGPVRLCDICYLRSHFSS